MRIYSVTYFSEVSHCLKVKNLENILLNNSLISIWNEKGSQNPPLTYLIL